MVHQSTSDTWEPSLNTANLAETSDRLAHLAAVVLRCAAATHQEKELAASALAQHHTSKQTSKVIGSLAAHVLGDKTSSHEAKELAGCVLTQVRHVPGLPPNTPQHST
jgi:hypothetical protein